MATDDEIVKRSPGEDGGAILTKDVLLLARAEGDGTRAADRWVTVDIADVWGDRASAVVRSAPCREYLRLIRTADDWTTGDTLWLPQ